jgi:chemotaxis methyl-accepting protein methylase
MASYSRNPRDSNFTSLIFWPILHRSEPLTWSFCRNVLIYFAQETKTDVLNRLAKAIASDGYLCSARQKRQSA